MFLSFNSDRSRILNFRVDTRLRSIIDPLTHKDLVFLAEKVRPLALSLIIDPVAFEMVSTTFGQHSVAASLPHVPHPFVDISIGVDHSSFSMG